MDYTQIDKVQVRRDGTHLLITMDDFINLEESPSVFFGPDDWQYAILQPWVDGNVDTPIIHLPIDEQLSILKALL